MAKEESSHLSDYVPTWFILVSFLGIMGLSLLGNLPVALSLLRSRRMKGVTSVFVMSLVVSSLMVGVGVTALVMVQIVWPTLMAGSACQIPLYVEMTCLTASIYSLVSVSIDRYVAVCHPTSRSLSLRKAAGILTMVWIGALVYASRIPIQSIVSSISSSSASSADPNLTTSTNLTDTLMQDTPTSKTPEKAQEDEGKTSTHLNCNFFVEEDEDDLPYRTVDVVLLFIIPFIALAYMYVRIGRKLWQAGQPISTMLYRKRQVVKMLIVTIALFFCCWIPFYAVEFVSDSLKTFLGGNMEEQIESDPAYIITRCVFILLALSNSFITPFIYIFYNENVKEDTKRFFLAGFTCCSVTTVVNTTSSSQFPTLSSKDGSAPPRCNGGQVFGVRRAGNKVVPIESDSTNMVQKPCDGETTASGEVVMSGPSDSATKMTGIFSDVDTANSEQMAMPDRSDCTKMAQQSTEDTASGRHIAMSVGSDCTKMAQQSTEDTASGRHIAMSVGSDCTKMAEQDTSGGRHMAMSVGSDCTKMAEQDTSGGRHMAMSVGSDCTKMAEQDTSGGRHIAMPVGSDCTKMAQQSTEDTAGGRQIVMESGVWMGPQVTLRDNEVTASTSSTV